MIGAILIACGIYSGAIAQKFCTVILSSGRIQILNGFCEQWLDYKDIQAIETRRKYDLIKLQTNCDTILGRTIWFKAKTRWWVAKPHPIVAELEDLCGLTPPRDSAN